MSLNKIDTYQSDEVRTLLLGHTIDSVDVVVAESLANELKKMAALVSSIVFSTAAFTPNIRNCIKV